MQRHDVDPTSLVFGLLFAALGLMLLIGDPAGGTVWLGWTGPAVAVGLGLLMILAVRPRRSGRTLAHADDEIADGESSADDAVAGAND
jgi:cytochrome c-type biogenesis protein CcmH/NrfF